MHGWYINGMIPGFFSLDSIVSFVGLKNSFHKLLYYKA